MFLIPGVLFALLTFPGVICHRIARRFFCNLAGIRVYKVSYFLVPKGEPPVTHGPIDTFESAFLITIGPVILNSALCSLISFSAVIPVFVLQVEKTTFLSGLLIWLGISMGMNAFPTKSDMDDFNAVVMKMPPGPLNFFGKWCAGMISVVGVLKIFWFDAIYALLVTWFVPVLMFGFWA